MEKAAALLAKITPEAASRDVDDAVLDAITLSACADGLTKDEITALGLMARELPTSKGLSDAEIDERVRASFERINEVGLEARLQAIGETAIDEETRRRMFSAAVIVQYADGHLTNEENAFLLDLADVLGLNETKVREIVEQIERELGVAAG